MILYYLAKWGWALRQFWQRVKPVPKVTGSAGPPAFVRDDEDRNLMRNAGWLD